MNQTTIRVKTAWKKHNRKVYIAGGILGGVAVGALVGIAYGMNRTPQPIIYNIATTKNGPAIAGGNDNTVTTTLERRGHPGFMMRDNTTGEVFASKNRMMDALGIHRGELEKMIADGRATVLGEAQ